MATGKKAESASRRAGRTTLLELVQMVQDHAASDAEVVATITHLINSGQVVLRGIFASRRVAAA